MIQFDKKIWIFISILVLGGFITVIIFLVKYFVNKSGNSKITDCTNKCGKKCCLVNQICNKNEKCCNSKCKPGDRCDKDNGCGGVCGCPDNQKCVNGVCCTSQCDFFNCGQRDGCGGICGCIDGKVCNNNVCCQCHDKICGNDDGCGGMCPCKICTKNNVCCDSTDGACIVCVPGYDSKNCSIQNTDGSCYNPAWCTTGYNWVTTGIIPSNCTGCRIINPIFATDGQVMPIGGEFTCDTCLNNEGKQVTNPGQITLTPNPQVLLNNNGILENGAILPYYADVCISDQDCIKRYGHTTGEKSKCINNTIKHGGDLPNTCGDIDP